MMDNYNLTKNQLIALTNVIECIARNSDDSSTKISKINYWFDLKYEM